jgi:hypothetical protein
MTEEMIEETMRQADDRYDSLGLKALSCRITPDAMQRLQDEKERRFRSDATRPSYGSIISTLALEHLPGNGANPKPAARARSRRAAKSA